MRLFVAIPSMGKGPLGECLSSMCRNAEDPLEILLWANGVQLPINGFDLYNASQDAHSQVTIAGSETNLGVTPALHKLYEMALREGVSDDDWILNIHDDTLIQDPGWDQKVMHWLSDYPKAALFGFGGARGLGDPELYQKPYELVQLARRDFISNMRNADLHGRRVTVPTRVATLDLFSIGAKVGFLKQTSGWNFWPHVHHSMDNALCCEAAKLGGEVWMFPIECDHLGGQTSTKVDFTTTFGEAEGKIHSDGHVTLYERYRNVLPLWVD